MSNRYECHAADTADVDLILPGDEFDADEMPDGSGRRGDRRGQLLARTAEPSTPFASMRTLAPRYQLVCNVADCRAATAPVGNPDSVRAIAYNDGWRFTIDGDHCPRHAAADDPHDFHRGEICGALAQQNIPFDLLADTRDLHTLLVKLGECQRCAAECAIDGGATCAHDGEVCQNVHALPPGNVVARPLGPASDCNSPDHGSGCARCRPEAWC